MKVSFLEQPAQVPLAYIPKSNGERMWMVTEDIYVTLSDGYELLIPKGFMTDLRSVPKWLWSIVQPFNDALFAYLIHDRLYADKLGQMQHFWRVTGRANISQAKKFADQEMFLWASALAPHRKLGSYVSYLAVRSYRGVRVYDGRDVVPV